MAFARPKAAKGRDAALALVAIGALVVAWGSLVPVLLAFVLAWLWWGRPLGVAAVLLLAVTLAAFVARDAAAKKVRWARTAPTATGAVDAGAGRGIPRDVDAARVARRALG
ncbi:MAG: hypothetical protein JNM10_09070 [Planctomycetia bacterium]|nr:hypothetical protein [Planctomycetia bacterium]